MSPEEFCAAINANRSKIQGGYDGRLLSEMIEERDITIRQSERAKAEGLVEALRDLIIEVERIGSTHKDILGFVINAKSALTKFNNEEK